MSISLYEASVPTFVRMLGNLEGILRKAEAHALAAAMDPAVLLASRLHPEMYPLAKQVTIAVDAAVDGAARLAQSQPPALAADEATFPGLAARIREAVAFLEALAPGRFDGAEERPVSWSARGATITVDGTRYLFHHAIPKFYFHVTTAYAILRRDGVALRKGDYMGKA